MYQYYIEKLDSTFYNLIIEVDTVSPEFAREPFSGAEGEGEYRRFIGYVKSLKNDIKIKTVKIFVSGILIASMPFAAFTAALASGDAELVRMSSTGIVSTVQEAKSEKTKFNMTYLYGGTVDSQIEQVKRVGNFDTVSPSYFDIGQSGNLVLNNISPKLIQSMHDIGVKVVPMISNHWNREAGKKALQNPEALAQQIAEYVEKYDLDGVNVDIENVTQTERDAYTQFVRLLREKIPQEKEVSVAVAANPNGWTTGWHGSYDYKALAEYVDYLMIMAYDESWEGSDAGPVASINFVERSIEYALKYVPAEKIVLGVPFYGRMWGGNGSFNGSGVGVKTIESMIEEYGAKVTYDESTQSVKAEFTVDADDRKFTINGKQMTAGSYTVWYENERSLRSKISLIHSYDLLGMGSWALNQASGQILDGLGEWLENPEGSDGEVVYGVVTADTLRVREKADINSKIISHVYNGDTVAVVGIEDGWYRIRLSNGGYGYVSADYVKLENEETERTGYCTGNTVRVRQSPATQGAILATVNRGTELTVIGDVVNGWYKVRLANGTEGYIHGDYVSFTAPQTERTGYCTGNTVRVRQTPTTQGAILTTVNRGAQLTVIGDMVNGWYKVRLANGTEGYIHGDYVSFTAPQTERTGYCTGNTVRVRQSPATQGAILTTVNRGIRLTVIGEKTNGWYKIRLSNGTEGYIHGDYVNVNGR